jgi:hypothetical protein
VNTEAKREANKAASASKELTALLEEFARNLEKNNFQLIERKFEELQTAITQMRKNLG